MRLFTLYRKERIIGQFQFIHSESLRLFYNLKKEKEPMGLDGMLNKLISIAGSHIYNYELAPSKVLYLSIGVALSTECLKFCAAYFWFPYANECYMRATDEGDLESV
jgi:hypothetical protein